MPSQIYMEILKELQSNMGAVNDIREANRPSPLFNHLTTVSEGIALLGWITIEPKPCDYITEALDSAQFYGNRVIKDYKEKSDALFSTPKRFCLLICHLGTELTSIGHKPSTKSFAPLPPT